MIPLLLSLIGAGTPKVWPVKPLEAVAVAQWYCRSANLDSYRLSYVNWAGRSLSVETYRVVLIDPKSRDQFVFYVDAVSGDVVYADSGRFNVGSMDGPEAAGAWLKKVGKGNEVVLDAKHQRYVAAIDGKRFFNLNGRTALTVATRGSRLARYEGYGARPPKPIGRPVLSKERAIAVATAKRSAKSFNPQAKRIQIGELGLLYDEPSKQTRWVWQVTHFDVWNGQNNEMYTDLVDATTGKLYGDRDAESYCFAYKSREPRAGLALVKPLKVNEPLIDLAQKKLKELGRGDLEFDNYVLNDGISMSQGQYTSLEMGADGMLREFKAPTKEGKWNPMETLSKGRKFILANYGKPLPPGHFEIDRSPWGNNGAAIYRQSAFGYDFLERYVAFAAFGPNGEFACYAARPPAPMPTALPKTILPPAEIERRAMTMVKPRIPKDTPGIHYYGSAKAGRMGWFVEEGAKVPTLCYWTSIWMMRDVKDWAVQGGGGTYPLDVSTGRCLRQYP